MKKLLCAVMALCMLLLCACGETTPSADEISTPEPTAAPVGAEALPEVCRTWYDIAENSGASEDGREYPLAERAHEGKSATYGVRLPDGSFTHLKGTAFDEEGIVLRDFTGGGAELTDSAAQVVWNGEAYDALSIKADDCTLPSIQADDGGLLRLDITGDCVLDGGGEEYACFENFDGVLITGTGTLTVVNSSGIACGGRELPVPALMLAGGVTLICDNITAVPNADAGVSTAVLGGALYAEFLYTNGGEVINAGGSLLARHLRDASRVTARDGMTLIDELGSEGAQIILSGGTICVSEELPQSTVIEGGAGRIAAVGLNSADARGYGAELLDSEADGSPYYQTVFDPSWGEVPGAEWNSLSVSDVDGEYLFAGEMTLSGVSAESLLPWGSLHLSLTGSNELKELGGAGLLLDGGGELRVDKLGVWGWGSAHKPVFALTGGTSVTVSGGEEFSMGSEAGECGLFLVDGGSFTCEGNFWLQNSVLEVRSGTVHITGDCALERGGINVSGGTLIIDGSLWIGEGDVTVSGGELVIPGGEEAIALDNGSVNVTGGAIK